RCAARLQCSARAQQSSARTGQESEAVGGQYALGSVRTVHPTAICTYIVDRPSYRNAPPQMAPCTRGSRALNRQDARLLFHEQGQHTMATNPMPTYHADDVLHIPIPPDISGYELVDGELEPVTPVGAGHGRTAIEIGMLLKAHVKQHRLRGRVYTEAGFV